MLESTPQRPSPSPQQQPEQVPIKPEDEQFLVQTSINNTSEFTYPSPLVEGQTQPNNEVVIFKQTPEKKRLTRPRTYSHNQRYDDPDHSFASEGFNY